MEKPVVTIIDGVAVHSAQPMSEDARGLAAEIIKAVREKLESERMPNFYRALKRLRELGRGAWEPPASEIARVVADALSALDDEVAAVEAGARDNLPK